MHTELSIDGGLQLRGKRVNGRMVSDMFCDLSSVENAVGSMKEKRTYSLVRGKKLRSASTQKVKKYLLCLYVTLGTQGSDQCAEMLNVIIGFQHSTLSSL